MKSDLIIISGPPATGKTYIANTLATLLSYPLVTKDGIKEILYDTIGTGDRIWSQHLGKASAHILHYILGQFTDTKSSLIVESAFYTDVESPVFASIIEKNSIEATQIYCYSDQEIIIQRFQHRQISSNRHKGHKSPDIITELKNALESNRYHPLQIPGKLIKLNTNDIENLDFGYLIKQID